MQRYHRRRHRLIWLVLAIVVPVVLAAGILQRVPPPEADVAPGGAQSASFQLPVENEAGGD